VKAPLPLLALLLAGACTHSAQQEIPSPAPVAAAADPAAEDARLTAFLDEAFDAQTALDPQSLTILGSKDQYGRLNDYTDAHRRRRLDLAERQLA
jgi:hypothetical protein